MRKWRRFVALSLVAVMVPLVWFGCIVWRSHIRLERARKEFAKPPPMGFRLPPKDLSAWCAECGANEPDPSTPEGKARLRDEERRLPEAQKEFLRLMASRPVVLTNEVESAAQDFLDSTSRLLDGFSRANCRLIMMVAESRWGGGNPDIRFENIQNEQQCKRFIERYYLIHCRLADWFWSRCGSEYEAAGMDRAIFTMLDWTQKDCSRIGWFEAAETIDRFLQIHRRDRCDSEKSNYCRAHRWGEELYNTVYAEIIKKDPRWIKGTSEWYGVFLESARLILKREPKWSPVYKAQGGGNGKCVTH